MTHTKFASQLSRIKNSEKGRRWLYVPYDQVTDKIGPLAREKPESLGIILVENPWKASRRPYHKQKLALILSNLRHFALEQAERGVAIRHVVVKGPYHRALQPLFAELGEITMMQPAERELRQDLAELGVDMPLRFISHEGWLTSMSDLEIIQAKDGTYRMDAFYRSVRQRTGILMEGGKPVGGKYSFDTENRQSWPGLPVAPEPPTFAVDEITEEVGSLINKYFDHHPGTLNLEQLPATQKDADKLWHWAKSKCMENFGAFEDAMSVRSNSLFHTRTSALINIHRLLPSQVVQDVLELDIPLSSKEGFIRQVLGWREFVHQIHEATDGFRQLEGAKIATVPGEANFASWAEKGWTEIIAGKFEADICSDKNGPDGGAVYSFLHSKNDLPPAYWGAESGLNCLDTVVEAVWKEGYSHHITRLMVLSNIANLLDISPRQLTDWFWMAYTDAYDWVVEPNVMAMGTYGVGGLMTTKPYVSGAAYINKMSDYCKACPFDPAKTCPITRLYWAFLQRHGEQLSDNPRLNMPLNSLKKRSTSDRAIDKAVFEKTLALLLDGKKIPHNIVELAKKEQSK